MFLSSYVRLYNVCDVHIPICKSSNLVTKDCNFSTKHNQKPLRHVFEQFCDFRKGFEAFVVLKYQIPNPFPLRKHQSGHISNASTGWVGMSSVWSYLNLFSQYFRLPTLPKRFLRFVLSVCFTTRPKSVQKVIFSVVKSWRKHFCRLGCAGCIHCSSQCCHTYEDRNMHS